MGQSSDKVQVTGGRDSLHYPEIVR